MLSPASQKATGEPSQSDVFLAKCRKISVAELPSARREGGFIRWRGLAAYLLRLHRGEGAAGVPSSIRWRSVRPRVPVAVAVDVPMAHVGPVAVFGCRRADHRPRRVDH